MSTTPRRALVSAPAALAALLFASPVLAASGASAVLTVVGRGHLLLLHFPIAVLFAVLLLELGLRRREPSPARRELTSLLLLLGSVGAVASAATGLLLASGDDWHGKSADILVQHRAGGIVTALLSVLAVVAHGKAKLQGAYLPALALACAAVLFTGHRGGQLVHGADYLLGDLDSAGAGQGEDDDPRALTSDASGDDDQRVRWPEGPVPETPDYTVDIQPLIERSCVKCHGPSKRKSGLRLDKKRFAMKGGETGLAIIPGDPEGSLFVKYIALSPDDDDVMPPKGKLLSASEIETVKKWIAQGAVWPDEP